MRRAASLWAMASAFWAASLGSGRGDSLADQPSDWPGRRSVADLKQQGFVPISPAGSPLGAWDVRPWHEGHWVARGDVIDYDGRASHKPFSTNSLWTKAPYRNFVLYAEWRLPAPPKKKPHPIVLYNGDFLRGEDGKRITRPRLDAGDSGIYLRGTPKCQANIWSQELGSGEINGYRTDRQMPPEVRRGCIPLRRADRPFGQWNAFLITVEQDRMTVVLNGQKVIDAVQLPGLPESGPIGLQHHGDPVQFRRLCIKELP